MSKTKPVTPEEKEYLEAQKRVRKIKNYYKDLASWAGTSVFLVALNLFLSGDISWAKYPVIIWGLFILAETFEIIRLQRMDKDWEQRQIRRFTGRSAPPPELNAPGKSGKADTNDHSPEEIEDLSDELLHRAEREPEKLSDYRKLRRPWKDEDLV